MSLSSLDLALIRDEVGTSTPDDAELEATYDELGVVSWIPTALRVLRRRRSDLAGSEISQVAIPGAISFGLKSNISSLDKQIDRLERRYADENPTVEQPGGATQNRITRPSYR